jgi:hypothetical protein
MNRLANTCFAALVATLHLAVAAYAASDEELYVLQYDAGVGDPITLTRLDGGVSGVTQTDIVSFNSSGLGLGYVDLLHSDGVFYVLTATGGNPPTWNLYTLDATNGAFELVDDINVDNVTRLFKNPADDTTWVTFDDDNDDYPESVAQIDLADGQVDTNTIVSLASPRFFSSAFFDVHGTLYGAEYSANTGWTQWWFRVNLDTGAISPDCPPGGSFSACWHGYGGWFLNANPDTNEIFGLGAPTENYFGILRTELYDTFMGVTNVAEVPLEVYDYGIIGATFAPNIKSPYPPLPPVLVMVGMCEIG